MTLGRTPRQADLFRSTVGFCEPRVAPGSIYGLLHRECERLFPDEMFADLFTDVGRRSVPPMIVAVVMVLQRIEGCSDREAVDRFCFDARWKYAAGGLDFDYPGFVHTVLVDMRARLAASAAPNRIFDAVLQVAQAAGLVGRRRVLDSTPIYDAVATMDTVTLVRSAIRGLLKAADAGLEQQLRAVLARDDEYTVAGKPVCDYDDPAARVEMVDALARDGAALLGVLDGREGLDKAVVQAGALLATVLGQDLDRDEVGVFRIARRVAKDRVISTVDPEARHGHKTAARGFDGYKGHIGIDPDSEIITATVVGPGNAGDATAAAELIGDLLDQHTTDAAAAEIDTTAEVATAATAEVDGAATAEVDGAVCCRCCRCCRRPRRRWHRRRRRCRGRPRRRRGCGPNVCVRRQRLRHRRIPGPVGPGRDRVQVQDPAAGGRGRAFRQGPIRHRSGRRHGPLPGRDHRADRPRQERRRCRRVRHGVRGVSAAGAVHHGPGRADDQRRRPRGCAGRGKGPATAAGLGRRLPGHQTKGGTQVRAPDAPQARRTPGPGPRHDQDRRRLLVAGRRGQPGTAGRTRGGVHQVRMGRRDRMSRHLGGETPSSGRRVASKRPLSRRTRGRRLLPSGSPNFSSIG